MVSPLNGEYTAPRHAPPVRDRVRCVRAVMERRILHRERRPDAVARVQVMAPQVILKEGPPPRIPDNRPHAERSGPRLRNRVNEYDTDKGGSHEKPCAAPHSPSGMYR